MAKDTATVGTIRKLGYGFLFTFRSNYGFVCIISEIKRDTGHKSPFSHTLHTTPPSGVPRRNIPFGMEKLKWRGYPTVKRV